MTCQPSTETEMPDNPPTMSVSTNPQEPPDISVLKDRSCLDYYITALKRWSNLAKAAGTREEFHADIVLDRAYRTYPELYMEMSDKFCDTLKADNNGMEKIIAWLNSKLGMNKHADMVRILNRFYNTKRIKNESLTDYITRFEKSYAEIKKTGESLSSSARAILLLRQADLTDIDHQLITVNLEFDPKSTTASTHYDNCKASMEKFQHSKVANNQVIGKNNPPEPPS